MKEIKLVIFDLDGTLADTMEGLKAAMTRTMTALGYPVPSDEELSRIVNYDTRRFVRESLPEGVRENATAVEQAIHLYLSNYAETCVMSTVYEGMAELLEHVAANCMVAIHSNKQDELVKVLEKRLFRPRLFVAAEGSVPGRSPKPDPAGVWEIMKVAEKRLESPEDPEENAGAEGECEEKAPEKTAEGDPTHEMTDAGIWKTIEGDLAHEMTDAGIREKIEGNLASLEEDDPSRAMWEWINTEVQQTARLTPEECIYVGDSDVDYLTARDAGMHHVSVAWGYRSEAFLRGLGDQPVATTPAELWDILVSLGVTDHE